MRPPSKSRLNSRGRMIRPLGSTVLSDEPTSIPLPSSRHVSPLYTTLLPYATLLDAKTENISTNLAVDPGERSFCGKVEHFVDRSALCHYIWDLAAQGRPQC